jgi:hypothetical protein
MGLRRSWRPPWGRSSRSLGEFEGSLQQHQSTQGGGLLLRTYALATLTSTTRLDFTSRCNIDALQPPTSTTRFNFSLCHNVRAQQRRVRLLRLREDDRWPSDEYFDYSSRLETSRGRASQQRLHQLLVST